MGILRAKGSHGEKRCKGMCAYVFISVGRQSPGAFGRQGRDVLRKVEGEVGEPTFFPSTHTSSLPWMSPTMPAFLHEYRRYTGRLRAGASSACSCGTAPSHSSFCRLSAWAFSSTTSSSTCRTLNQGIYKKIDFETLVHYVPFWRLCSTHGVDVCRFFFVVPMPPRCVQADAYIPSR